MNEILEFAVALMTSVLAGFVCLMLACLGVCLVFECFKYIRKEWRGE